MTDFVYLPSIFYEPYNSVAATGTSGKAWISWLCQADHLAIHVSDTVLHSSCNWKIKFVKGCDVIVATTIVIYR